MNETDVLIETLLCRLMFAMKLGATNKEYIQFREAFYENVGIEEYWEQYDCKKSLDMDLFHKYIIETLKTAL